MPFSPPARAQTADSGSTSGDGGSTSLDMQGAVDTVLASLETMWTDLLASLPQLAIGLIVLVGTAIVAKIVQRVLRRVLERTRLRGSLIDLAMQLVQVLTWTLGLLVAATVVFPGITPGKLLTVLGLSSIAIGFAFKDIFENFFAGILILWRFPLEKGDVIDVNGIRGRVEEITIRMTQIRTMDDQLVVLPNGHIFKQAVTVATNQDLRRMQVMVGVAYDVDLDQARQVIRDSVEGCEGVSDEKPVQVFAQAFGSSSVDFEVCWWSGSQPLEERETRDAVVRSVKRALDDAGIEIPFPYRTLTFKEPLHTVARASEDDSAQP